jgi:hypothetical protein
MPQSLRQASALLKAKAHVNLADYFEVRTMGRTEPGGYADLVHMSANAMRRYTRKHGKFVPLDSAKGEWLQPLLRDFRFKNG